MLTLPAILDVPDKLLPVINDLDLYRYFMLEGGRGSAKSHTVARLLLYIGERYYLRIVCGREIQSSIEESVYTLFCDLIREHNLNYHIAATEIWHRKSGTTIRFHGFREHGSVNIKGLEGVDILWVDEAQAITQLTLNIIIPTIRKEKSKVFWTMNRDMKDDPVYAEFEPRDDCMTIHIDYFENKHCPAALKIEAEKCKAKDIEEYEHIWLGQPRKQAATAAFKNVDSIVDVNLPMSQPPRPEFSYVMGVDLAKSLDFTVIDVICIELKQLVYHERMESENRSSWNYQKQKIMAVSELYNRAMIVTDSTGVGDPITEDLQRMGCNVFVDRTGDKNDKEVAGFKFNMISKENIIEKLKVTIELQLIRIPDIPILIKELKQFQALKMPSGRYKYSAPAGKDENGVDLYHDDCVIGLALAMWGSRTMIYDPQYSAPVPRTYTDEFWARVKEDIKIKENDRQGEEVEYDISEDNNISID